MENSRFHSNFPKALSLIILFTATNDRLNALLNEQAENDPSQRHIQGSKIAKGLENFQVGEGPTLPREVWVLSKNDTCCEHLHQRVSPPALCLFVQNSCCR